MSNAYSEIKFHQELIFLKEAVQWLSKTGIKTDGTRLIKVLEYLQIIVDHYGANKVSQLFETYPETTIVTVVTDATAFIRIYQAFKNIKSDKLPRTKLKKMISGPLLPWDESPNKANIEARNILFELEMVAWLKGAGFKIKGYDDAQFTYKNKFFHVECKRIHSSTRVDSNISDAVTQLRKKMGNPKYRGLICLCIDKLTGKEGWILSVPKKENIYPLLNNICTEFIARYKSLWQSTLNIHILGTLIYVPAVAEIVFNSGGRRLINCRITYLDIIPQNKFLQQSNKQLATEIYKKLINSKTFINLT